MLMSLLIKMLMPLFRQFTEQLFNFGFYYGKNNMKKGRLLTLTFGQVKLEVYLSRKEKLDKELIVIII